MSRAVLLVLLAACGRFNFGSHPDGSAPAVDALPLATIDTSVTTSYPVAVLADHPLAYYRLDESSATTAAVDVSGNGNHGGYDLELGGTASFMTTGALVADADLDAAIGVRGGGNTSDGSVANLRIPTDTLFPWAGDFTVEGWLKPLSIPPDGWNHAFFVFEHFQKTGFRTGWTGDLHPIFWTTEAGSTGELESPTPLVLGAWNYLVIEKRGAAVAIYIDAVLVAQATTDYNVPVVDDPKLDTCFGACHGMPSEGVFDELAIYDYALPIDRIVAHHDTGIGIASQ